MFNHMVEHHLDRVFHALSDPTRRAILDRLAEGGGDRWAYLKTVSYLFRRGVETPRRA